MKCELFEIRDSPDHFDLKTSIFTLIEFQVVGSLSIHCFKICDILIKYGRSVHNSISWLLGTFRDKNLPVF